MGGEVGLINERFIPAGAGNTVTTTAESSGRAVYPRWRGEHAEPASFDISHAGLSPLARGTRHRKRFRCQSPRFIPAGAGNTVSSCKVLWVGAVYPRWRGEHSILSPKSDRSAGLSPLARGTPGRIRPPRKPRRFIPAGAGNTQVRDGLANDYYGLSPLARGTLRTGIYNQQQSRFIPAGAGNTNPQCSHPDR